MDIKTETIEVVAVVLMGNRENLPGRPLYGDVG